MGCLACVLQSTLAKDKAKLSIVARKNTGAKNGHAAFEASILAVK